MILETNAFRSELASWSVPGLLQPVDDELLQQYVELISEDPRSLFRERAAGHFTSSALLVDPRAGQVLLLMHPRVGRWLQFGGHIELADACFAAAALRECREESGYRDIQISQTPVALDRHPVPCSGGSSVHWDIQFLASVDKDSLQVETENLQVKWFDMTRVTHEIPDLDPSVRRLVAAAVAM